MKKQLFISLLMLSNMLMADFVVEVGVSKKGGKKYVSRYETWSCQCGGYFFGDKGVCDGNISPCGSNTFINVSFYDEDEKKWCLKGENGAITPRPAFFTVSVLIDIGKPVVFEYEGCRMSIIVHRKIRQGNDQGSGVDNIT